VFLECASSPLLSAALQQRCAGIAQQLASYLFCSQLWDDTFSGGWWWSSDRTMKPSQSNALVAQFLSAMYLQTANATFLHRARETVEWSRAVLYAPAPVGLNAWYINDSGVNPTYFAYDNALVMSSYIRLAKALQKSSCSGCQKDLNSSKYVGWANAMLPAFGSMFWLPSLGAFQSDSVSRKIFSVLSGWVTQELLFLVDSRVFNSSCSSDILQMAFQNILTLNFWLQNSTLGAFYLLAGTTNPQDSRCCDWAFDLNDSAWMQRQNALLAAFTMRK
jgi:hypothetical protein